MNLQARALLLVFLSCISLANCQSNQTLGELGAACNSTQLCQEVLVCQEGTCENSHVSIASTSPLWPFFTFLALIGLQVFLKTRILYAVTHEAKFEIELTPEATAHVMFKKLNPQNEDSINRN